MTIASRPTLAKAVRAQRPEWSWNECRSVIHQGRVTINDETITDETHRVLESAHVTIHAKPTGQSRKAKENSVQSKLKIYYLDDHLVVVEKPSGIESVPFETKKQFEGKTQSNTPDTLVDLTRKWIEQKEGRKRPPLKVVHRLDKGTSGVIVFARTIHAERGLGILFRTHDITRSYIAVCHGTPESATIQSRIAENRGDGKRGSVLNKNIGKESITHVTVLEKRQTSKKQPITMIECKLETGRTHQIRIHLAEAGHSLCGETVYLNKKLHAPEINDTSGVPRIALHAQELGFVHPITEEEFHWSSTLPRDLSDWWDRQSVIDR